MCAMRSASRVGVIVPAFNEEASVQDLVRRARTSIPAGCEGRVAVADNGSTDRTGERAAAAGAEVVREPRRGYGAACLAGIRHLAEWPDIYVFLDADGSSRPEEMADLLSPVRENRADLTLGYRPPDAPMTAPQRWGTWLAIQLVNWRWGYSYRDMGPFRAIRRLSFRELSMRDRTWGWTVEMQILALLQGLRIEEVPVSWLPRLAGKSKISGTLPGVVRAGGRILWTIGRYWSRKRTGIAGA